MMNPQQPNPEIAKQPHVIENAAIYVRVAVQEKQHRNAKAQTDDLRDFALQLGWSEDHIIVFDQDNGLPGNTTIAERTGLASLVLGIEQDKVKTILVSDLNRIFRDAAEMQVSIFMRLCQEHNICIITPDITYNFTDPVHVKLFRFCCEHAYSVLEDR